MSQDLATEVLSASLPNSLSARSVHLQLRIISDSQILSWLKKKKKQIQFCIFRKQTRPRGGMLDHFK